MTVKADDLTHPKNHYCAYCKAIPGQWCVTWSGQPRTSFEKQHVDRLVKADKARGGRLVGGTLVRGEYIENGTFVPQICVDALTRMQNDFPGCTYPEDRPYIVATVLNAYFQAHLIPTPKINTPRERDPE